LAARLGAHEDGGGEALPLATRVVRGARALGLQLLGWLPAAVSAATILEFVRRRPDLVSPRFGPPDPDLGALGHFPATASVVRARALGGQRIRKQLTRLGPHPSPRGVGSSGVARGSAPPGAACGDASA
jgi:hypothetical protein